jgi:hypothetical protein
MGGIPKTFLRLQRSDGTPTVFNFAAGFLFLVPSNRGRENSRLWSRRLGVSLSRMRIHAFVPSEF